MKYRNTQNNQQVPIHPLSYEIDRDRMIYREQFNNAKSWKEQQENGKNKHPPRLTSRWNPVTDFWTLTYLKKPAPPLTCPLRVYILQLTVQSKNQLSVILYSSCMLCIL